MMTRSGPLTDEQVAELKEVFQDYIGQDRFVHTLQVAARLATEQAIPEGMVLVPREPTRDMMKAGMLCQTESNSPAAIYRAMIAAAIRSGTDGEAQP
jgi:hypothetical protein